MIQSLQLNNGVHLLAEPESSTEAVSVGFWFPFGSRDESLKRKCKLHLDEVQSTRGAAHFVEHMLFKGTTTRNAYTLANEFDRIGGYINAFTERELVCVHFVVPYKHCINSLNILCDMIANSVFSNEDFFKERSVIESEILSALEDSEDVAQDAVMQTLYQDSSISWSIAGSVDELKKLTRDSVFKIYQEYFKYGKLIVSIAGKYNFDEVKTLLQTQLPSRKEKKINETKVPHFSSGNYFLQSNFLQTQCFISFPISIPKNQKEYYIWEVANSIIGDAVSSRLFQTLREKCGLCYNVYSSFSVGKDTALWFAYAAFSQEKLMSVINKTEEQIISVLNGTISDSELVDAKMHLQGEISLESEDMEFRMKRNARQFLFDKELYSCSDTIKIIDKISISDVNNILKNNIIEAKKSIIVFGPKRTKKFLKDKTFLKIKKNKSGLYEKN